MHRFLFVVTFAVVLVLVLVSARPSTYSDTVVVGADDIGHPGGQRQAIPREKMCRLPAVRGHCRALLPRWRYDPKSHKCLEFKFGGCDGNGNNFYSEKECMHTCKGI